jgi:hypothetical protein
MCSFCSIHDKIMDLHAHLDVVPRIAEGVRFEVGVIDGSPLRFVQLRPQDRERREAVLALNVPIVDREALVKVAQIVNTSLEHAGGNIRRGIQHCEKSPLRKFSTQPRLVISKK